MSKAGGEGKSKRNRVIAVGEGNANFVEGHRVRVWERVRVACEVRVSVGERIRVKGHG